MEDRGDWDVPGAVVGPKGLPGDPGAVPKVPSPLRLVMDVEAGVGKIEDVTPDPRLMLLRLDVRFPSGPSVLAVGPGPGKPI